MCGPSRARPRGARVTAGVTRRATATIADRQTRTGPGRNGAFRAFEHTVVEYSELVQLARPRTGHFDLGTGYHGDLWLDLDALFLRPSLLRPHVDWLAERLSEHAPDAVCGPLEGG